MYQHVWNICRTLQRGKCTVLKAYIRKENLRIKNLEKEHQTKFTRRKEIKTKEKKKKISEIGKKNTAETNKS